MTADAHPIIVCPLTAVERLVAARAPSHLITLLSPESLIDTPHPLTPDQHLRLGINDINEPMDGLVAPDEQTVRAIVDFGAGWDASRPILIHCWAGISRSTATAFILACERNPHAEEEAIAHELRRRSRFAQPNPRLVALADALMGRGGRMSAAVAAMSLAQPTGESEPFELPARW